AVAYGVLSFQFDIHPTILTIQIDMEKRHKVKVAIVYGFGASLIMFLVVYVLAYTKFSINVNNSILESLPTSTLFHLGVLMVAFQLCLSLGISNSALYQNLEDYVGISKEFNYHRCLLRTVLTVVAIVSAECVPEFDLVMSVIGGTLTGPLVFIFPPLIYLKLLSMEGAWSKEHAIKLNIVEHPAKVAKCADLYYTSIVHESRDYPKLN
ncbi:Amino acid transporter, partial [Oryctes borbonicus]